MVLHFVWLWWWQFSDSIFIIKSIYKRFFEATDKCFPINGCFGHYFKSIFSTEPRWFFRNWERFFFIIHLSTITSLSVYPDSLYWENLSHLQRENFNIFKRIVLVSYFNQLFLENKKEVSKIEWISLNNRIMFNNLS